MDKNSDLYQRDMRDLKQAQCWYREHVFSERQYIVRAAEIMMRELAPVRHLISGDHFDDIMAVLRFHMHTDPTMRVWLGLPPFEDG